IARGVQIVETCAGHVDQTGVERVCKDQRALLRIRCLVTLGKAAAIGNPSENAGNKLRIIDVAEPVEKLVSVAEVNVHAGIEGVAVLKELGRGGEIAEERTRCRVGIKFQQIDGVSVKARSRKYVKPASAGHRDTKGRIVERATAILKRIAYK